MKGRILALMLGLTVLLTGCGRVLPYAREMGDMALMRVMGVDGEEDGLSVTVSTGKRASGLQNEEEGALILSLQGQSLSTVCQAMQGASESYVFYGYVDQLLLGEEMARQGAGLLLPGHPAGPRRPAVAGPGGPGGVGGALRGRGGH